MLTQDDLRKIGELIETKLDQKLRLELHPIKGDIKDIHKNIQVIYETLDKTDTRLSAIERVQRNMSVKINKIRKDQKLIVNFFDNEYLNLKQRVNRIVDHIQLPPAQ